MSAVSKYSCAGKVFISGEYAVLAGAPAIVAAVGPRFELEAAECSREGFAPAARAFHPESPAGRLLARGTGMGEWNCFRFTDPHSGRGGFGASSAQFILAAYATGAARDWRGAYSLYRELHAGESQPPSGADVVAQEAGGVVAFDPIEVSAEDLSRAFPWDCMLVFSATGQKGRKVETHHHLSSLAESGAMSRVSAELGPIARDAVSRARSGDVEGLGLVLRVYAQALDRLGLEIDAAREDRQALSALPGVAGVKGAGAHLADAVVVLMSLGAAADQRSRVLSEAARRGLALVADGLAIEAPAGKVRG